VFDLPKPILAQLLTTLNTRPDTLTASERVIALKIRLCSLCHYLWVSRKDTAPARCPNCHSPAWDRPLINTMLANQQGGITVEQMPQKQLTKGVHTQREGEE